ncbi:tetratricopeptide repeat protein, partial [Planobispora rosea]
MSEPAGQDPPTLFDDLHQVAVLRSTELGGQPSYRQLAEQTDMQKSTIENWLKRQIFPRDRDQLLKMIEIIRTEAHAQGKITDPVAALLDPARWKKTYDAECDRRAGRNRDTANSAIASTIQQELEHRARWQTLSDRPRPVSAWSAKQLGVHGAIAGTSSRRGDFIVPTYIPREHDQRLRNHLSAAVGRRETTLVLVRGTSCSGKTRTAFEAVRAVVPGWSLVSPKTADSLLAFLAVAGAEPNMVLWLNEVQNVLQGPAGETAAAGLLTRLEGDEPTLIIATLSPLHKKLTATPEAGHPDPHPLARALLAQAHLVDVPKAFPRDQAAALATHADPSLRAAARSGTTDITQTLTAGPALVDHYENPTTHEGIYGRAVIEAAMDAHRLDATGPLPLRFLENAAPGYLRDDERAAADDDSWFSSAMAYARIRVKDVVSALQPVARPTGMGALPGVVTLADYLQQYARITRSDQCPPATFWQAAVEHLSDPKALLALSEAAAARLRRRHAALLCQGAAEAGDPSGWAMLALARELVGDRTEAERLAQLAAEAGDASGWVALALVREEAEAERLYQAAAEAGSPYGWVQLALIREKEGNQAEAERLAQLAAEAGDASGWVQLALTRDQAGNQAEAERLYQAAAEAGSPYGWVQLALIREEAGNQAEAGRLAQLAAEAGDASGWVQLALIREEAGNQAEAERLAQLAAEAGDASGWVQLALIREEAGNQAEAERLAQLATEAGSPYGWVQLALTREQAGNQAEAERLAQLAA